jgi:hypothetical protein
MQSFGIDDVAKFVNLEILMLELSKLGCNLKLTLLPASADISTSET